MWQTRPLALREEKEEMITAHKRRGNVDLVIGGVELEGPAVWPLPYPRYAHPCKVVRVQRAVQTESPGVQGTFHCRICLDGSRLSHKPLINGQVTFEDNLRAERK